MIQVIAGQAAATLKPLFDLGAPTGIRCFAVLNGGNAGRILTDDPEHPQWAYVWEADDGTLYRGGRQDAGVLGQVVHGLGQESLIALGYRDGDPGVSLFPPNPNACAACLEFRRPMGSSDLTAYLGPLGFGYEIYRMDRQLLESSPHYEGTLRRYGSVEACLEHGIAVCLLHGKDTVCEAYADMDVLGVRELGVMTQKPYRGRGFATVTCAHLLTMCEEQNSQAYWDCARLNTASARLARKLGFRYEREYRLLAWFPEG